MTTPASTEQYLTRGGITVRRTIESVPVRHAVEPILEGLDQRRGALLTSSYEYPGRYTRWDLGFIDPPLVFTARGRTSGGGPERARPGPAPRVGRRSRGSTSWRRSTRETTLVAGQVRAPAGRFTEEDRSRQPSVFSLLRALVDLFFHEDEPTSACTARSATTWRSSSSRCGSSWSARPISAISSSTCRTS